MVNEEHDDIYDETSDGVNEHDDVIGDDDDDHHVDVVEEAEEAHKREVISTKRNIMTATTVHPKTMIMKQVGGNNAGIEKIESDGSEEDLVQDQEDPNVEDSGKECNDGVHNKPPHEHFPKEVGKIVEVRSGKKTLHTIRLWTCTSRANAATLNLR